MNISLNDALNSLEQVVEELGEDFAFEGRCSYVRLDDDQYSPNCGVGKALCKLGVDVYTLKDMDNYSPSTILTVQVEDIDFDIRARFAYYVFQHNQDSYVPYGECLRRTKEAVALLA